MLAEIPVGIMTTDREPMPNPFQNPLSDVDQYPQIDARFLTVVNSQEGSVWNISDGFLTMDSHQKMLSEDGVVEGLQQISYEGTFMRNCADSVHSSHIWDTTNKILAHECQEFLILAWGDRTQEKSSILFHDPQNPGRIGLAELTISQILKSMASHSTLEAFMLQVDGSDITDLFSGKPAKNCNSINSVGQILTSDPTVPAVINSGTPAKTHGLLF